jgi:hypothetical protein
LPDLSWHKVPKRGKIYQIAAKLPNGHKIPIPNVRNIFQMAKEYTNLLHSEDLRNFFPNWYFWFENIPSGNPVIQTAEVVPRLSRFLQASLEFRPRPFHDRKVGLQDFSFST